MNGENDVKVKGASAPRQDYFEEPTQLERLITAQFRRGIPVPLTASEQQKLLQMSLEQRCDYIAKICVWTAQATLKRIAQLEE